MTISILSSPRQLRNYLVYDMEWVPGTLQIRLIGVYDGNRYRCYETIQAFIDHELTNQNRAKWFYAHAGGLADFQFLLEKMSEDVHWHLNASFSGSSAIIVNVTRGKNSWHFVDSYWLLREKLRKIGEWIGISKGNDDESVEFYSQASFDELRDYNERDCIILYEAIQQFEQTLLDLGGQLKMTQAGCAMELFRRRFLKQDIDTSQTVNDVSRKSYFASRVEVITTHCNDALYYDVNSSFPYSMTYPVPGERLSTSNYLRDNRMCVADVIVKVPDSYFPPLPKRHDGRLFFPTGQWRNWFTNIDLDLLQSVGGKVLRVYEVMYFEERDDLKDYAVTLYNLRKQAKGFEKIAYKYLLNSLYGKFAETDLKSRMVVHPRTRPPIEDMVSPGIFVSDVLVPVPHMHVPISAHITAIARRTLYRYMSLSSELHYCDTDGFSTTNPLQDGNDLGAIKLEKYLSDSRFIAAKVYQNQGQMADWPESHYKLPDGQYGPLRELGDSGIKAKGYSKMTLEKFERLTQNVRVDGTHNLNDPGFLDGKSLEEIEEMRRGEEIEYTRMRRIKEIIRSDDGPHPREDIIRKRLRLTTSKRFFYPDGHSRPWHTSELDGL